MLTKCFFQCAIVPFLSQEVFNYITAEAQAYSICLDSTINMSEALAEHKKGIAAFAGIGTDGLSILTIRDPSEMYKSSDHGDHRDSVSIYTRQGRKTVSADQYMDLVETFRPDIFHALCDGETNATSSNRRLTKSVERTKAFLHSCLERYRQSETMRNQSLFVGN